MAENKTKPTGESVTAFLDKVADPGRRKDCYALIDLMKRISGSEPRMWGSSIVGFGEYTYHYASGRSGIWPICGFSPRKGDLTIYLSGYLEMFTEILSRLGKIKHGKGCLYIRRLVDVNLDVLEELVKASHASRASGQEEAAGA